jgi:hypothetical protein
VRIAGLLAAIATPGLGQESVAMNDLDPDAFASGSRPAREGGGS